MNRPFYRAVFLGAAAYDLVIGAVFLFAYPWLYGVLGLTLPTEPAYLHAAAAFVLVQGIMYVYVWRDMVRNRDLALVGAIYKAAYAAVAFYHWTLGDLPHPLFAVFGITDVAFLALFVAFLGAVRAELRAPPASTA
jgi:hypothetical protein